jgi:hypothetical protein
LADISAGSSSKLGADGASAVADALVALTALQSLNVRLPNLKGNGEREGGWTATERWGLDRIAQHHASGWWEG